MTTISGVLFSIHPIHTEAVAGIVGRADVLCGAFFLLTLLSYKRYCVERQSGRSGRYLWLLLTVLLMAASTLSKEIGITVLGVCVLYDVFSSSRINIADLRQWRREKVNYVASL